MTDSEEMTFGFPEFASTVVAAHGPALKLAHADSHLANEMLAALPKSMRKNQIVIYMLVRMAITGWVELLLLVGKWRGPWGNEDFAWHV
jgi:hypothetical protein